MPYVTSWERIAEKKGMEKGMEKGLEKKAVEVARELVKNGVDINIIARSTGLPLEKIEKLATVVH